MPEIHALSIQNGHAAATHARYLKDLLRILLVDDHPLIRDGLRRCIERRTGWHVCGESASAREALELVQTIRPDLAIVDLSLTDSFGLELVKQIAALGSGTKVLVCSMMDESAYAQRAIIAGAAGFVNKQTAMDTLVEAIEKILAGGIHVSEALQDTLLMGLSQKKCAGGTPLHKLTNRETAVVQAIGQGRTVSEIARVMNLSPKTVETYRERAKQKLGFRTSAELLRFAVQQSVAGLT
jgi:DNA-binding NarL/FixJ family response regulator